MGGQKVKVVLAAAMWNTPHIIILSHNAQFVDQVCPEVWHLENHTLNLKGSYDWLENANKEAARLEKEADEYVDGSGNTVAIEKKKKPATKQELKKVKKKVAEKRKAGIEVFTDDELEEAGFLVE